MNLSKNKHPFLDLPIAVIMISIPLFILSACGGGSSASNSGNGSTTAVGSLISDATSGYLGSSLTGSAASVAASNSASIYLDKYVSTSAANTYTDNYVLKSLTGSTWTTSSSPFTNYELSSSGWVAITDASTTTIVDSGDGSNISETDGAALSYSLTVTKTDLSGTTFANNTNFTCGSISGTCSGTYPSGSTLYTLSYTTAFPILFGAPSLPITDPSGASLTALPVVGTTIFCDPSWLKVYQPLSSPTATANYGVYTAQSSCSAPNITTALGSTQDETILLSVNNASNTAATQGLLISNESAALGLNTVLFGLASGNVFTGYSYAAGTPYYLYENKTATNAELSVDGLTLLP